MNKETNPAVLLGQMSWKTRSKGKTKKQRSDMMRELRLKRKPKLDNLVQK